MRSKKYKKIILGLLAVLLLFIISAYFVGLQTKSPSIKLQESSENPAVKSSQEYLLKVESIEKEVEAEKLISTSLKVQDKTYATKIKEGSSAYDLMNQLKTQGLSFSATEYSDLGFFVTEINGVKEDRKNATYWTLYFNGKEATIGASKLILKENNSIEWKYEKRN